MTTGTTEPSTSRSAAPCATPSAGTTTSVTSAAAATTPHRLVRFDGRLLPPMIPQATATPRPVAVTTASTPARPGAVASRATATATSAPTPASAARGAGVRPSARLAAPMPAHPGPGRRRSPRDSSRARRPASRRSLPRRVRSRQPQPPRGDGHPRRSAVFLRFWVLSETIIYTFYSINCLFSSVTCFFILLWMRNTFLIGILFYTCDFSTIIYVYY